ncbi:hypothetical protein BABINDRAFT_116224 [Babjeviella inositovora NRRL Y-12698]|uniref:Uncharacterized protein n=1 Tax=Babjeviella inositovora NRRL Y-12698 TaxID=984486 RepID=A0A1E3QWR8_9ASCO|nr:uncharacterized protein BABINDRAFT_116224 [Babjeviella inositovora NRRL Y-12698]ODQ82125.1 hypothetical protein BABINDRAFT_116224 [Babjeviella inositovora NRRL Y-12698]
MTVVLHSPRPHQSVDLLITHSSLLVAGRATRPYTQPTMHSYYWSATAAKIPKRNRDVAFASRLIIHHCGIWCSSFSASPPSFGP